MQRKRSIKKPKMKQTRVLEKGTTEKIDTKERNKTY